MANSKITFTFSDVPEVNQELNFRENLLNLDFNEIFKANRWASYQTKIPNQFSIGTEENPLVVYGGYISENYKTAFNLDYNGTGLYTVQVINGANGSGIGVVIITANYPGAVFEEGTNSAPVFVEIENEEPLPDFSVTGMIYTTATTEQCQKVKVNVETDALAVNIIEPFELSGNEENPFSFDWPRAQTVNLKLQDENGTIINFPFTTPDILNSENFATTINGSPNGSTVVVNGTSTNGLTLEYSLDNTTWQSSNVFSGLAPGEYTLYVRDHLGCSFNRTFSVNEFGIYDPYFYISKSNSIRYAQRIDWDDAANYKTDENSLSCESDVKVPYKEIQQFQSSDTIITQFRSNYDDITANVIRQNGDEVALEISQKTANIGVTDKRDAKMYDFGNGKTAVYFLSGNIYNYSTNAVVGPYALNGTLPMWGSAGNYIVIDNAWYLIEDILFDESKNAEVLIFSNNYSGAEINIIAGSVFNVLDYEVYEFSVDMGEFLNENIQVRINNESEGFTSLIHLSELINVRVKQEDTIEIRYKNRTNTDVFYATGIEHMIRQLIQKPAGGFPDEKSDTYKTDTNVILLSAELYEGDEFIFEPVTKEIMRKLLLALSHESIFINGIGYVKNDAPEVEGPLEESNLYVVKARMLKSGYVYNSQSSGIGDEIYNGENIEIPGLIDFGGGLLRY